MGVDQRASIGGGGRIDERIDAREAGNCEIEDHVRRIRAFEISLDESASRAGAFDGLDGRRGLVSVPSDDDDSLSALGGGGGRGRGADPKRAAVRRRADQYAYVAFLRIPRLWSAVTMNEFGEASERQHAMLHC